MDREQHPELFAALEERFAGYTVHDRHHDKIGKVDDLFVDEEDNPEYVGVKMGFLGIKSTLIPMDIVRVNEKRGLFEIEADKGAIKGGPTFDGGEEIAPEFERRVCGYYGVEGMQVSEERGFYGAARPTHDDGRVDVEPGERTASHRTAGEARIIAESRGRGAERVNVHKRLPPEEIRVIPRGEAEGEQESREKGEAK